MSILIKGMDKPTDCGLCPFEDFGYCNVKGERNTSESGIDTDCPLIEVADRKTESNSEKPNNCETCKWGEWYRQGYDITMMDDECGGCCSWNSKWTPKGEPTISKMEQVDKPQTPYDNCQSCLHWVYDGYWYCECNECRYEPKVEPQTDEPPMDEYYKDHDEFYDCDRYVITNDEGERAYNCIGCQTDCAWK